MPRNLRIVLAASVFLLACGHADNRTEAKPAEKRVHVDTKAVVERTVPKTVKLTGVLEAFQRTDLAANASGRVVRTFVELGQRVEAGALLAQLDSRTATLTQAETRAQATSAADQLANVRAECARYEQLLAHGAVSQQEYDAKTTQCHTQAASLEAAQARAASASQVVHDANIRAPFAGVIAERFVNVGDYVHPDGKIVTLLVDDPLRLRLTVPEPIIGAVHEGVVVTFSTISAPGRTFSATLKFVGREVRATTRDMVVEAIADNHDGALVPGMFVIAELPTGEITVPVVPRKAIVETDTSQTAFVVVGDRLEQRVLQTGATAGDDVAVLDGVKKDERIVVNPSNQTVDGVLIE